MVNITGFASAPYSEFPTASNPSGISELPINRKKSQSLEGALDQSSSPLDAIDDDSDSLSSSTFGSQEDDPPEYPGLMQGSEVFSNPTALPKVPLYHGASGSPKIWVNTTIQPSSGSSLSNNNCIVCHRPKPFKDIATCGDHSCDQELRSWQGRGSPLPNSAGSTSISRCPVCNDFKLSDDAICGKEYCLERLRLWGGIPDVPPSSRSPGSELSCLAGSLSDKDCIVCHRPGAFKDTGTCGDRSCDEEIRSWQEHGSPLPNSAGISSSNRCPVCNKFKPCADACCGKEFCVERLRVWQGIPNVPPSSSRHKAGSWPYSTAVQTRSQARPGDMCEVCHQRPRCSQNGKSYPVCGLTCAAKLNSSERVEMCDFCHKRPKVYLHGKTYPHCGRTCRDKAGGAKKANNGFGTRTCTTCLNCWKAPANLRKDEFCSESCRNTIEHRAPLLLEVPRGHASFNDVEKEFKSAWTQHLAPCPSVKKIYMVCIPAKHEANFEDYGKVSSTGRRKEEFRWISGQRDCPLGQPGMMIPCQLPQCQLCHILRGTYVPEIFDTGISTMSLPSATHHYDRWAANTIRFENPKVVLLSKVYLGKVVDLGHLQAQSGPPKGADSVRVKLEDYRRSRVDTDEVLVYSCDALRPIYIIAYD